MANPSVITIKDKKVKKLLKDLIKQTGKISQRSRDYVALLGAVVLEDVEDHFNKQQGPSGPWAAWSPAYKARMSRLGKSGNFILTDTGRLRKGWQPARHRTSKKGVLWFNPVSYASLHNDGSSKMPKRHFAWLSKRALTKMEKFTAKFMLKTNG